MKINKKDLHIEQVKEQVSLIMASETSLAVRGKTVSFKPARLVLVLALALIILVAIVNLLLIPSKKPHTVDMNFESGNTYTMQAYNNDLLMYNNRHIKAVNKKGETLWNIDLPLSIPHISSAGNYILAVDLSGNNYAGLYKKGALVQEFKLGNDIISADVNKKGNVVFATSTNGYKGKIVVFDKKGRELFAWNSGEGYLMDVAINNNGKYVAAAQLLSDAENISSRIQFIDIHRKKVIRTADRTDTLVSQLRYADNRLLSVSDSELCGFTENGREQYVVSFSGKKPEKFDISSNDLLTFVTGDNKGNTVLEIYNTRGKLKGKYISGNGINTLSVSGDTIVISRNRDIMYINHRGKLKKKYVCSHDIKSVGIYGNGKTVMAAGSTAADIMTIK